MRVFLIVLGFLIFNIVSVNSQSIKSKNQYGEALYFIDENSLKIKNNYGSKIFFWNGKEIKTKNKY